MTTKHICLYGGPGISKSTTAAGLFNKMKKDGFKVELVQEYAKELTYREDFNTLENQLFVLANQHKNWFMLEGKVDYVIHDSPLLLSLHYAKDTGHLPLKEFKDFVLALQDRYDTINFLLRRNKKHLYQRYGRTQTLQDAIDIDRSIGTMLNKSGVPYDLVDGDVNTIYYKLFPDKHTWLSKIIEWIK